MKLPFYELCEELVRQKGFTEKNNVYVRFFLEEIFDFSLKPESSLETFLEKWKEEQNQPSIVVSEGTNAVKIMTIHHAKGLEFETVIFPFADWKFNENQNDIWVTINDTTHFPELKSAIIPASQKLEKTAYADDYTEEKNKIFLDNLNLIYVAMTRAEKNLFVLTSSAKKDISEPKNSADMFAYYLQQTNKWEENKTLYEFGKLTPQNNFSENKFSKYFYPMAEFNSQNWRENIKIRTNVNDENLERNYGIAVHLALSKIKTLADIPEAIKKLATKNWVSDEELKAIEKKLTHLLQSPEIKIFFRENLILKSEKEIVLKDGTVYRPDRIIFEKDKTIIIDFKTGEKFEKYKKQLAKYADALAEMGYKNIEKYVLYIEKEQIEAIR